MTDRRLPAECNGEFTGDFAISTRAFGKVKQFRARNTMISFYFITLNNIDLRLIQRDCGCRLIHFLLL